MSFLIYIIVLFCGLYLPLPMSSFSVSISVSISKTSLLGLLYPKDCITPRQSWLFFLRSYKQNTKKQDKMKLENI